MLAMRIAIQAAIALSVIAGTASLASGSLELWDGAPFVGALVLTAAYDAVSRRYYTRARDSEPRKRIRVNEAAIASYGNAYFLRISAAQAYNFIELILYPAETVDRITESVELKIRSLVIRTASTLRLNKATYASEAVLSLEMIVCGRLIDGLEITSSTGERLSSLTCDQSAGYVVAAITKYLEVLGGTALNSFRTWQISEPIASAASAGPSLPTLENAVTGIVGADRPCLETDVQTITDNLLLLPCATGKENGLLDIAKLVRELASHYALVVALPVPEPSFDGSARTRVTVQKRTIPLRLD